MAEHIHHEATCPMCGGTLMEHSEAALIEKVQHHAKEKHDKDLTTEQARGLFKGKAK